MKKLLLSLLVASSFLPLIASDAEHFYVGRHDDETDKTTIIIQDKKLVSMSESLNILIERCADRLYCQAELNGGGKNGVNYQKVTNEYVEKFKAVLQKKDVFVNQKDEDGKTPLMRAAWHQQWELMELLIKAGKAGADTTLTDNKGLTALDCLKLRNNAGGGSFVFLVNMIMGNYYTKARYNKCINLLVPDIKKRQWYKRWIF